MSLIAVFGAAADPISASVQAKVNQYKQQLIEWSRHPAIVAAVKEANAHGGPKDMNNAKWNDLAEDDPIVKSLQTNSAGVLVSKWEYEHQALGKLYVRSKDGNLVAGSNKPLLYNNANRAPFSNAIKGTVWSAGEVKPDPTTQRPSVQISVPIMDNGKPIGVLHTNFEVQ